MQVCNACSAGRGPTNYNDKVSRWRIKTGREGGEDVDNVSKYFALRFEFRAGAAAIQRPFIAMRNGAEGGRRSQMIAARPRSLPQKYEHVRMRLLSHLPIITIFLYNGADDNPSSDSHLCPST
jgi:hypothetical protein